MEANPWAAVNNNISSTLVLLELCSEFNVDRFILISSDKAVFPSSVMGVTKRICEQITLSLQYESTTKFIAVRFGNVLGSSGSVIPKFMSQIESGGPITVTDPNATRYFMLIPEAVELVLQAGAIGESGNIYVLDMGEPVNISELASYMVKLSGLKLNEDIQIIYTGLRPGEKLHESLYLEGEEKSTDVPDLLLLTPRHPVGQDYIDRVRLLLSRLWTLNDRELHSVLQSLVPEYKLDAIMDHSSVEKIQMSEEISCN
jgi:FlaA1/EpsC-like NDP-sugar epimerase